MWQYAQCVCWELFHPFTPSVSSMWFLLSSTYMYFLVFLYFVMISLNGNTIVRVLSYSVDRKPLQFPLILRYLYMSCDASIKKKYMVFEDCGQWVSGCWKSTTLFLFLMHLYSFTSDVEPGKAYRWRGAPAPCVCWYIYLQTSSQENNRVKTTHLANECLVRLSLAPPSSKQVHET